ncbi:uncharacterized protein LOC142220213 isoform X2 [Haematobia irritans]|uniref:uncharacterized protein LOC142220213 isoform X2 n=1 Tax=Haematobia irritans TaxID=7368 RepID=UPI003F4FB3A5
MPISEYEFGKLQILTINIFIILLKASILNPYHLKMHLEEPIDPSSMFWHHILVLLISILLIIKFLAGYTTLAANTIAIFPILTEALPHLLIPPIIAQTLDHVLLNLIEILLGYFTLYYYAPTTNSKVSVLVIFLTCMTMKIVAAIATLNLYSDFYQQLKTPKYLLATDSEESLEQNDKFLNIQTFD